MTSERLRKKTLHCDDNVNEITLLHTREDKLIFTLIKEMDYDLYFQFSSGIVSKNLR